MFWTICTPYLSLSGIKYKSIIACIKHQQVKKMFSFKNKKKQNKKNNCIYTYR